jgi:predicted dehydrogenase
VSEPLRIALVGAGRWGQRYIATIAEIDDIDLCLVASRNPATRSLVPADCEIIADWRGLFADRELDGLIVATPPASHYEITRACIEAGLAVLVEKPFTLDLSAARDLEQLARERGSLVMVNHTHIFGSAYATLKQRVRDLEGPLRIRSIGGNDGPLREDVDALWDYGPHDLSMCLDLVGQETVSLRAQPATATPREQGMLVDALLEFADGSQAEITVGNQMTEKQRMFSVRAGADLLVYDDLATDKLVARDERGQAHPLSLSPVFPLTRSLMAFRDAIVADEKEHESLALGVRVVDMLEQISTMLDNHSHSRDNIASL